MPVVLSIVALAAVLFLLGFIFSTFGDTPEESSSLFGIDAFVIWMLMLVAGLWRYSNRNE